MTKLSKENWILFWINKRFKFRFVPTVNSTRFCLNSSCPYQIFSDEYRCFPKGATLVCTNAFPSLELTTFSLSLSISRSLLLSLRKEEHLVHGGEWKWAFAKIPSSKINVLSPGARQETSGSLWMMRNAVAHIEVFWLRRWRDKIFWWFQTIWDKEFVSWDDPLYEAKCQNLKRNWITVKKKCN